MQHEEAARQGILTIENVLLTVCLLFLSNSKIDHSCNTSQQKLQKKQDDPIDFEDPKFLSTSNPRWVQAGLSQKVIDVLSEKGITKFTPVQGEAFDPVLAGRDVIGRSRTGTGKTLAFGLPSLTRLVTMLEQKGLRDPATGRMERGRPVSMLVLCPTRELARQVQEELAAVARPLRLFVDVFHGGVSYEPQVRILCFDCLVSVYFFCEVKSFLTFFYRYKLC